MGVRIVKRGKEREEKREERAASAQKAKTRAGAGAAIVRLCGIDVSGELALERALERVRGIGPTLARAICLVAERLFGISASVSVNALSEEQLARIEEIVAAPQRFGLPTYLLNQPKSRESTEPSHLTGTSLTLSVRQRIEAAKAIRSWVGWRHAIGQKVRGQRTRTTGRTGLTIGVLRRAAKEALKKTEEK